MSHAQPPQDSTQAAADPASPPAPGGPAAPAAPAAPASPPAPAGSAEPAQIAQIRAGYEFAGGALEFGAAVIEGTAYPSARVRIPLSVLNRHGLVAGATGTGKTKTLQLMAEQLSQQGVPVFLADIKGDLSGMASPGEADDKVRARAQDVGEEWVPTAYPAEFYALGGQGKGIPIRASVSAFGPTLLAKVLELTPIQESSLGLVFHYADAKGLYLDDIKDLRAVVQHLTSAEGKADLKGLGGLSSATAGVILRELIMFADQGADVFFGRPEFDTADLLRAAADGRGMVSVLELSAVQDRPQLFPVFLMWLLADLFHDLPEVGDLDQPKLVFFFDEAHLLFTDASKDFLTSITQTVRLIRSKGVGVFFVTQSPKDVPPDVLGQLGSRVQHALRAFTPEDAKALKAAVSTYPKSGYDLQTLLTHLGTGEAVITVLSERGAPTPVAWTRMRAPQSLMAPSPETLVDQIVDASTRNARYAVADDRHSAYESIQAAGAERAAAEAEATQDAAQPQPASAGPAGPSGDRAKQPAREEPTVVEKVVGSSAFKSMLRSAGTVLGREITRSIFGTSRRR